MSHQVAKVVKVKDLSETERKARGLADAPEDMEVSIVVEEIVTDSVPPEPKPIELKQGQKRRKLQPEPAETKGEKK